MDGKKGWIVRSFVVLDGLLYGDRDGKSDEDDDDSDAEPYENQDERDKMDAINEGESDYDDSEKLSISSKAKQTQNICIEFVQCWTDVVMLFLITMLTSLCCCSL